MKLTHVNISQIIDLVEFIYRETSSEDVDGPSPMRTLIMWYHSCNGEPMMENDEFRSQMDGCAEIGSDMGSTLYEPGIYT